MGYWQDNIIILLVTELSVWLETRKPETKEGFKWPRKLICS